MFKEFNEYSNPETKDYDITSSFKEEKEEKIISAEIEEKNHIIYELLDLLGGVLEDEEYENIEEYYGITLNEYYSPTRETIEKVKRHLGKTNVRK